VNFWKHHLWLTFAALGVAGAAAVWFLMPHQSQIDSVWQMLFKLLAFLLVVLSIAFFPNRSPGRFLLVILPFFAFAGFLIPRLSYFGFTGIVPMNDFRLAGEFYTVLYLLTYPAIVLTTTFAFRLGGGTPGQCVKVGLSGALILFSGFLDVLWHLVNPVQLPDKLQYAHHIAIVLGHYPSYREGVVFTLCHLPFLVGLLVLPLDRWFHRLDLLPGAGGVGHAESDPSSTGRLRGREAQP
jgi:hypothetical protein